MDTTGYDVEMDELGGLPTMGTEDYDKTSSPSRAELYFEDEEEDLIDCSVAQYVPAVEFYADAGGCPQHLSIVNYNEFAQTVSSEVNMHTCPLAPHCDTPAGCDLSCPYCP